MARDLTRSSVLMGGASHSKPQAAGRRALPAESGVVVAMAILAVVSMSWAIITYVGNPAVAGFWAWIPSMFTYFALAAFAPRLRPVFTSVTATVWVPLVGLVVLVFVPLAILIAGPTQGRLPVLPEWEAINYAMLVSTAAYASLAVATVGMQALVSEKPPRPIPAAQRAPVVLIALAYLGALVKLQMQGGVFAYFAGSGVSNIQVGLGVFGVAGTFLPALGPVGAMLVWRSSRSLRGRDLGIALLGVLPLTTFSYNRGSWVFPLVTILLILLRSRPSLGRPAILIGLLLIPMIALTVGTVRAEAQLRQYNVQAQASQANPLALLQVYGNSPQQQAVAMAADPGSPTLLASVLTPVPLLGKPFRDSAGPAVWNYALYGDYESADQILPLAAELFWIAGLFAVVVGFGVVGLLVGYLGQLSTVDADPVRLYLRMLLALWLTLGLTWSASVMSQMIIYFWLVPYVTLRVIRRY